MTFIHTFIQQIFIETSTTPVVVCFRLLTNVSRFLFRAVSSAVGLSGSDADSLPFFFFSPKSCLVLIHFLPLPVSGFPSLSVPPSLPFPFWANPSVFASPLYMAESFHLCVSRFRRVFALLRRCRSINLRRRCCHYCRRVEGRG